MYNLYCCSIKVVCHISIFTILSILYWDITTCYWFVFVVFKLNIWNTKCGKICSFYDVICIATPKPWVEHYINLILTFIFTVVKEEEGIPVDVVQLCRETFKKTAEYLHGELDGNDLFRNGTFWYVWKILLQTKLSAKNFLNIPGN